MQVPGVGHMLRPLGISERLMYDYSQLHPRHFCVALQLKARRSPDDFRHAVRSVQHRHPLLRAIVLRDPLQRAAFYDSDIGREPAVLPWGPEIRWENLVQSELEADIEPRAPLFRATVLHRPARAMVIFTFHHAIADANAGLIVLRDLLRALAGDPVDALDVPDGSDLRIGIGDPPQVEADQSATQAARRDMLRAIARQQLWRPFEGDRISVASAEIPADLTELLRDRARSEQTTINSVICTALAIVAGRREGLGQYTILTPVDLRQAAGFDGDECAMRAYASPITISNLRTDRFWETCRRHTSQVNAFRNVKAFQASTRDLSELLRSDDDPQVAAGLLGSMNNNAVVSNLGVSSLPQRIGDIHIEGVWGPAGQARMTDERFIGVVTYGGVLRLLEAIPSYKQTVIEALVDRLFAITHVRNW